MTFSNKDPGSKPESVTINGVSPPRPLPKTCGPACIVSPLYVLLNLESPHPEVALRELPSVIGEHSGHTTVYLVLDVPSAANGRLFFEFHGFLKSDQVLGSSPGPAEPAWYHPDWSKYDGLGNLRKPDGVEA